jgi:hypothetical protein
MLNRASVRRTYAKVKLAGDEGRTASFFVVDPTDPGHLQNKPRIANPRAAQIIFRTTTPQNDQAVTNYIERRGFRGIVASSAEPLKEEEIQIIRKGYPETDFNTLVVVNEATQKPDEDWRYQYPFALSIVTATFALAFGTWLGFRWFRRGWSGNRSIATDRITSHADEQT